MTLRAYPASEIESIVLPGGGDALPDRGGVLVDLRQQERLREGLDQAVDADHGHDLVEVEPGVELGGGEVARVEGVDGLGGGGAFVAHGR